MISSVSLLEGRRRIGRRYGHAMDFSQNNGFTTASKPGGTSMLGRVRGEDKYRKQPLTEQTLERHAHHPLRSPLSAKSRSLMKNFCPSLICGQDRPDRRPCTQSPKTFSPQIASSPIRRPVPATYPRASPESQRCAPLESSSNMKASARNNNCSSCATRKRARFGEFIGLPCGCCSL